MAIFLSGLFFWLSLLFIVDGSGILAAFFFVLSTIAFMNHSEGNGPQSMA